MEKKSEIIPLIHCVVRYGQIIGCYAKMEDASFVANTFIQKGQLCDIIVKPLLNSIQNG